MQPLQSTVAVSHNVPPDPDATVGVPFGQVHVLATHVCAEPEAAVADMVYPVLQTEQSTVSVSHNVPPVPDDVVGVPLGQVQVFGSQLVSSLRTAEYTA